MPETDRLILSKEEGAKLHHAALARMGQNDPLGPDNAWDFTGPLEISGGARSSLIVDPASGKLPYTEEGRARRAAFQSFAGADGPEQRGLNERCLMAGSGYAPFLSIPAANIRQIVQTRDTAVILTESFGQLRIIPLDGRASPAIPRGGSSAGRWEGEVFVVETTGFLETDRFRVAPLSTFPISPTTRIVERFTPLGPQEILYRFTVEDALLYTRPWTAESLLKRSTDRMFEWACHEANYGLANILRGERVVQARQAAQGKP
jgi:hypothetical protein